MQKGSEKQDEENRLKLLAELAQRESEYKSKHLTDHDYLRFRKAKLPKPQELRWTDGNDHGEEYSDEDRMIAKKLLVQIYQQDDSDKAE